MACLFCQNVLILFARSQTSPGVTAAGIVAFGFSVEMTLGVWDQLIAQSPEMDRVRNELEKAVDIFRKMIASTLANGFFSVGTQAFYVVWPPYGDCYTLDMNSGSRPGVPRGETWYNAGPDIAALRSLHDAQIPYWASYACAIPCNGLIQQIKDFGNIVTNCFVVSDGSGQVTASLDPVCYASKADLPEGSPGWEEITKMQPIVFIICQGDPLPGEEEDPIDKCCKETINKLQDFIQLMYSLFP